jgi:hypothetical protein
MKAIKMSISGIKCDSCDYRDDAVAFKDSEIWLNQPCPWCGANLLTQKDLDTIKRMIAVTNFINRLLKPFLKPDKDAKGVRFVAEMNGTGKVNFRRSDHEHS